MTPHQAAAVIGCTPGHVRTLARKGILEAREIPTERNQHEHEWFIYAASARDYASKPQAGGWPRGESRGS